MDLPYMYDVCMTRLTHDSTHSTHSIRLLTRLDDSTHSTRLQDALSILFNRDFLRIDSDLYLLDSTRVGAYRYSYTQCISRPVIVHVLVNVVMVMLKV